MRKRCWWLIRQFLGPPFCSGIVVVAVDEDGDGVVAGDAAAALPLRSCARAGKASPERRQDSSPGR